LPPIVIILYVALSLLVGFFGRNRTVGFAGMFVLSLLLTPIVMGLVLLVSAPKSQDSTG
jgi:hypothetical protein